MAIKTVVFYESGTGNAPVQDYIDEQSDKAQAAILAAIEAFTEEFPDIRTVSIKHLSGKIWELRIRDGQGNQHRVLYAVAASALLLLEAFHKKTQKTPPRHIELAKKRLKELTEDR